MASKVQIANLALIRLNAATITSFTDATREAELVNTIYEDIAAEVMSEGEWSSTITRVELAKLVTNPEWGFDSQFQLPTEPRALKILEINEVTPGSYTYRIEGDKLLINTSSVKIKYIGYVDDSESYDTYLKQAIVSRLAAELAYPLAGDKDLARGLYERYRIDVQQGLAKDGQQGSGIKTYNPDLIEVRGDGIDDLQ